MTGNVTVEKNRVFGTAGDEYLTADTYRPADSNGDLPVLVLIHGGAFQTGSKEMYCEWGQALACAGYFVMAINYRLATPSCPTYPGALEDVGKALNWLVANAHDECLDVTRIGLIGDSAGAHLASLFALKNRPFSYKICAVVGVYGIYDLVEEWQGPVSVRSHDMFMTFLGCSANGNGELFAEVSPVQYIADAADSGTFDTSFYLVWGAQDKVVNPKQSEMFRDQLYAAGIRVESTKIDDVGHFWFNKLPRIDGGGIADYPNKVICPQVVSFLDEQVKNSVVVNFSTQRLRALALAEGLNFKE